MRNGYYNDTVCLVTGSSSGIGASLVKKLIERGAKVVVGGDIKETDFNHEKFIHKELDVTDYSRFKEVIDEVVEEFGKIDLIFNNAGIAVTGEALDIPLEYWKKILDVNLYGVIYGTLLSYEYMIKQGAGHIVNISSVAGFFPIPLESPYVVSKFGVLGLSLVMRVEGALKGVKVSAVCPGFVKTPIFLSPAYNVDLKKYAEEAAKALGEVILPDECADVILDGVEKNKAIITVTEPAKWMWWLSRVDPDEMLEMTINEFKKILPAVKSNQ